MTSLIDKKEVLLNERVLFKESQLVELPGNFPIRIRANSKAALKIGLSAEGGIFELAIDGMSTSNFDQVTAGSGSYNGKNFEYIVHSIFVAALGNDKVYDVSITVYPI